MSEELMLTTIDNPFNPFTQFDDWYAFDTHMGYNSCSYLARIAITAPEQSVGIESFVIARAVEEIVKFNLSGKHIAVTKENFEAEMERVRQHRR